MKDLLAIADLSSEEITLVLDTAEAMREIGERPIKKVPTLRGKTVVNLFYEPSTRTRTSFEIAEKRLSADTLNIAVATSSVLKGETLVDTALNIEAMAPDMIVLRHPSSGAGHLLSRICRSRIINAGDGMHEHPTQALLDAFTMAERQWRARKCGAPEAEWRTTIMSGFMASRFCAVSRSVSPFWALEVAVAMERLSAESTFSATSKLARVRVEAS